MPGLNLFNDSLLGEQTQSGILSAPSSRAPGIDLAPRLSPDMGSGMPTSDIGRAGLALQEFGAGIRGLPSPIGAEMARMRQERALRAVELKADMDVYEAGVKAVKGKIGAQRKQIADDLASFSSGRPGLANAIRGLASQDDGNLAVVMKYAAGSPTLKRVLETGGLEAALKIMDNPTVTAELDTTAMRAMVLKANGLRLGYKDILPPEMVQRFGDTLDGVEFNEAQEWMRENLPASSQYRKFVLDDAQLFVKDRNLEGFHAQAGMVSPKDVAAAALDEQKKKSSLVKIDSGGSTQLFREGDVPAAGLEISKTLSPAQEETNRLREEANRLHATLAGASLDMRRQGLALQADRLDQQRNQFTDTRAERLANELQQNKIPGLQASIKTANDLLRKYSDKDIPGFGIIEGSAKIPNVARGSEATNVRSAVQAVTNDLLNLYSGLAVTLPEADRRELEQMNRGDFTNKDFKNAWPRIVNRFNTVLGNMRASASPEVIERYASRPGAMSLDPIAPAFAKSATGHGIPPGSVKAGFTPDGKQVWKDKGGKNWIE